ncbi:vomeronasal type-2 receptor 26-like [Dendrobates tinctorius]|uniref:vomeronasal type-2 receptor 26-like n=1 Tax=Dendrobates tinctorius TaxID=92724 RepID=UPI003CCA163C
MVDEQQLLRNIQQLESRLSALEQATSAVDLSAVAAQAAKQTPLLLNYGQHPCVPVPMPISSSNPTVVDSAVEGCDIWDHTQDAMKASKERMRVSADAHHRPALIFKPDEINKNPYILPNVTLGYHVTDSCNNENKAIENLLQILSGPGDIVPNYSCLGNGKLVGVVGDQSSKTSLQIIEHLNVYGYTQIPVSKCTEDCPPGYRRILMNGSHKCCFECLQCSDGEISNETDKRSCIRCPRDQWPNDNNQCAPKETEFLSYTDDSITIIITLIVIFLFLKTSFILGIFTLFRDTPVVKASNQSLSFSLLVSVMLSFLCIFLFLGRPTRVTCMLRQTSFGIIFSVTISSILAKTIMVYSAFKATKPGSKCRKFIGVKIINCLVFVCSFVQVVLCIIWLSTAPPFPENNFDLYVDKIILQCNEGSIVAFSIILGYIGFLAAVSFLVAFLARNLPDSFNEAKYITFSMLVVCSVWVAFIPAYLSVTGKSSVLVEIFAILSSSVGILACIFYPKCYIIILRPDLNSKDKLLKNPKYGRENLTT